MKLTGVDFWAGHTNVIILADDKTTCNPYPITISEKVRLGVSFKVEFCYISFLSGHSKLIEFLEHHLKSPKSISVAVKVVDKESDKMYYRIEMRCNLKDLDTKSHFGKDIITAILQPREIKETYHYDKKLQTLFE